MSSSMFEMTVGMRKEHGKKKGRNLRASSGHPQPRGAATLKPNRSLWAQNVCLQNTTMSSIYLHLPRTNIGVVNTSLDLCLIGIKDLLAIAGLACVTLQCNLAPTL